MRKKIKNKIIKIILLFIIVISINACIAAGGIIGGVTGSTSIHPIDNNSSSDNITNSRD